MKNNQIILSDLSTVAALQTLGFLIEDIRIISGTNKCEFIFEEDSIGRINQIINKHYNGALKVSSSLYFANLKSLKSRIFNLCANK
jgi:Domain of unknown function (DUF5659)